MPWLKQLVASPSPQRPRLMPLSVYVGFVLDRVALRHAFLSVLQLSSVSCGSPFSHIIWGMNSRPVGGLNSETLSHPIDMNSSNNNVVVFKELVTSIFRVEVGDSTSL
jgi:hypothetical protein